MAAISKESAKFIFEGKVTKTKAANVKAMSGTDQSAIVAVERVVSAPEPLIAYTGRNVTVRLAEGERLKQGQRATFYTTGLVFGENLAVQSLGHEPVEAKTAKAAAMAVTTAGGAIEHSAARMAVHKKIREQASEAPVVITGKVVAVGLPTPEGHVAAAAVAGGPNPRPISEHEPFWREAVVEVQNVHKGTVGSDRVVLRFPSSNDVRWYRAPKFKTGQEGVFSLHRDAVSGQVAPGAMAASLNVQESYTCLDPDAFQAAQDEAEAAVAIDAAEK
ncbi:MAG: copper resistance protein [Bradyrhizobium sp.]|jgi:hypothetical protein|nr:copper resistance protein [Bradyrhizobium sp.]